MENINKSCVPLKMSQNHHVHKKRWQICSMGQEPQTENKKIMGSQNSDARGMEKANLNKSSVGKQIGETWNWCLNCRTCQSL